MKKQVLTSLLITVLLAGGILLYTNYQNKTQISDTVEMNTKNEEIILTDPQPDQTITSPITITGQASGSWYFEGQFPVTLLDAKGNIIGSSNAIAQGEWTIEELVPFVAELAFAQPETSTGKLVLQNDNPSGLAENQKEFTVSVQF